MCRSLIYLICFAFVLGPACVAYADIESGLAGYWPLDGDAKDASGNGNNGVINGNVTSTTDRFGNPNSAMKFPGSTSAYINLGQPPILLIKGAMTVAAWVRANTLSQTGRIIAKQGPSSARSWGINLETAGHARFDVGINPTDRMRADSAPLSFGPNDWWHIAGVFRPGVAVELYINGELVKSEPTTMTTQWIENSLPVNIGRRPEPGTPWNGDIDEARIYSRALAPAEIRQVMIGKEEGPASNPSPADRTTDVPRDVALSWTPGEFANTHDVYFGTNFNDVNDASTTNPRGVLISPKQSANSYEPAGLLDFGQTYYWRVDEVNAPPDLTIYKGDVWSFTVEPVAYPIASTSITAAASSQFNENTKPENTINGSGLDNNDLHSTAETAIWLSSMTGSQPTWIQYEFDQVYKLHQMWVWNYNASIEPVVGFGFKDVTIEYSTDGVNWTTLGTTHQFARAPGAVGYAHNTTIDLSGVLAKYVKLTANSNWGGMVPQYGLSEVRFFYIPVLAREQNPTSGSTDMNVDNVTLSWRAGREAAKHNVYLSTDQQAVINETISPVSIPAGRSYISHDTGELELGKSYYWKVNEVNEAQTPAIWQGDVLNFSTQEYLVADDFEDYNDFEPDRIFDTWIDGWADPANGSQVGYAEPPFAEKTIIHGGKQSMPLSYDNSTAGYSEATANIANLAVDRDWTKYGIKTLSLWFRGDPNNTAERMYVKLNGSKVVYDGDADNITRIGWQPWNIELASFGVNLRNVTGLSIGFERSGAVGGKGKVYFDDIRLYPYSRQFITPAEPNIAGLAGYWQFEGNLSDSSGNGRNGIGIGNPTFEAGKVGQAVNLRGVNDYVVITGYKGVLGGGAFSITAWVKTQGNGTMVNWGTQLGGQRVDFRLDQGRLRIEHGNGNLQANTVLADGQWHHVALTVSENAPLSYPAVKLYLDGCDDSQTTVDPDTFNIVANVDVNIGRRETNNDRVFTGSLDEVRIYERVLSPEDVAWLAGRTKPFDKPLNH